MARSQLAPIFLALLFAMPGLTLSQTTRAATNTGSLSGTPESLLVDDPLVEFPLPPEAMPPDGLGTVGLWLFSMEPNDSAIWDGPQSGSLNPGFWIDYIVAGSLSMTAQGSLDVIATDGRTESVPAGQTITLESGDTAIHRIEERAEWTNPTATEARIVSFFLMHEQMMVYPIPLGWDEIVHQSDNEKLPAGEWHYRLEERMVEPEQVIDAPAKPSIQYGVADGDDLTYIAKGSADQLTLRGATTATTVYVATLSHTGSGEATPQI